MQDTGRRGLCKSQRGALVVALLFVAVTLAGACGNDDGTASAGGSGDAVKIGAILSTSGAYSQLGAEAELALDGFADVWRFSDGRRIEFEVINDASDPTQAAAAAQTFAEEGVAAIIGPSAGATMTAAFPVLSQLGIPVMIGPPIPYPNFNDEPFIFSPNIPQVTTVQREDFEDYLEARGRTSAVQLSSDDASGQASAEAWSEAGYDTKIVPLDVTNYQPVLSELRSAGHDALLTFTAGGQPPAHAARAREALGWEVDQYLTPANLNADYIELAGDAAEGSLGFVWPAGAGSKYFADNPDQQEPLLMLEKALPDEDLSVRPNVGYYWDHALALALAIDEVGVDPDELREQLETQEFWGVNGFNHRTADDHVGYQRESAIRAIVRDGRVVPNEE